jgi:hypothetical protein
MACRPAAGRATGRPRAEHAERARFPRWRALWATTDLVAATTAVVARRSVVRRLHAARRRRSVTQPRHRVKRHERWVRPSVAVGVRVAGFAEMHDLPRARGKADGRWGAGSVSDHTINAEQVARRAGVRENRRTWVGGAQRCGVARPHQLARRRRYPAAAGHAAGAVGAVRVVAPPVDRVAARARGRGHGACR